jgi:ribonucleoside-diphosphate reductase alpha chain
MHGAAYAQSSRVARDHGGAFPGYAKNRDSMMRVMRKHRSSLKDIDRTHVPKEMFDRAKDIWDECVELGEKHGYRNAQATVLAPTGTIGFMMDCDTTGVEPDIALVKYKKLVGGGLMKIVNNTVPSALTKLGYTASQVKDIIGYIDEHETIEGAPHLKDKDLAVFDCAFKATNGVRSIHYMGHIKMMGAVQPFISGAISKTVNVPKAATVEEIEQAYIDSWRIGAKAVSIYRDGSKRTQPLNTSRDKEKAAGSAGVDGMAADAAGLVPRRRKLPDERQSITHKFDIGGHEGYITVGLYEDGQPGELFLTMAKEGSTISGFADAFAQAISYALQYGVPLHDLVEKFSHVRFEPSGMTRNPEIRFAKSIVDYIFRWLSAKFMSVEDQYRHGVNVQEPVTTPEQLVLDVTATAAAKPSVASAPAPPAAPSPRASKFAAIQNQEDAPPCSTCGSIMVRSGACYKCANCGTTSGCA